MAYRCSECGLPVYAVMPGDGFTSCDCIRCTYCHGTVDDCECNAWETDDEYDPDEEVA